MLVEKHKPDGVRKTQLSILPVFQLSDCAGSASIVRSLADRQFDSDPGALFLTVGD